MSTESRQTMTDTHPMDRQAVHDDYERARLTFHRLIDAASAADLAKATDGTRWTNKQLLWHMLFGYMIVRALLRKGHEVLEEGIPPDRVTSTGTPPSTSTSIAAS
ncbi:hypothetical protein J7E99_38100 [Streptomyces sp. ISL-44]|uniref:hypothetical protein n=1 Tax=Streptomyces sp. ISL-44 TaxID=2819184 RepID=UPI001BE650D5|nr:hypothetical protein [Streptomyces sp. ISL-44]MBT2546323.1 hypothetical protein [Streptomyces sp. ISL-44]